jgi:hypothetical protein
MRHLLPPHRLDGLHNLTCELEQMTLFEQMTLCR